MNFALQNQIEFATVPPTFASITSEAPMSADNANNSSNDDQTPADEEYLPPENNRPNPTKRIPLPFEKPIVELEQQLAKLEAKPNPPPNIKEAIRNLRLEIARLTREIFDHLDPSDVVKLARDSHRPQTLDYLELIFDEFIELHGDHAYRDDRAILTGFAKIDDQRSCSSASRKGETSRNAPSTTTAWRTRRAIARPCKRCSSPPNTKCQSSLSSTPAERTPDSEPKNAASPTPSPTTSARWPASTHPSSAR